MKYLTILLFLLATVVTGDDGQQRTDATLVEVIEQGRSVGDGLGKALRGLKYPHTINTDTVQPDTELLEELTQRFLRWKSALETVLLAALRGLRQRHLTCSARSIWLASISTC